MRTFSVAVWWITVALAIAGLLFRSLVWASWAPASPDDPYGLSDVLEVLIWFTLLGLCGLCLVVGAVFGPLRKIHAPLAIRLVATAIILPPIYRILSSAVPTFRLWQS